MAHNTYTEHTAIFCRRSLYFLNFVFLALRAPQAQCPGAKDKPINPKFSLRTLHHSKQREAPRVTASNSASNLQKQSAPPHRFHSANQVSKIVTIFSDRVSEKAEIMQYQESKSRKSWLALAHTSTREDPRGHTWVCAQNSLNIVLTKRIEKLSFCLAFSSFHIPARYCTSLFSDNRKSIMQPSQFITILHTHSTHDCACIGVRREDKKNPYQNSLQHAAHKDCQS